MPRHAAVPARRGGQLGSARCRSAARASCAASGCSAAAQTFTEQDLRLDCDRVLRHSTVLIVAALDLRISGGIICTQQRRDRPLLLFLQLRQLRQRSLTFHTFCDSCQHLQQTLKSTAHKVVAATSSRRKASDPYCSEHLTADEARYWPEQRTQHIAQRHGSTMLSCLVRALYGDLPHEQLVQASFFSLLLCMIVGVYWMMRSLKDSVFATTVGLEYQPTAKMLSLVVVTVMLFFYNKLVWLWHTNVDMVPRDQLFKVICCGYSGVFLATAFVLQSSTHGLYGSDGKALPASPDRLVGWVHYFAIESYGNLQFAVLSTDL
eukprot:5102068-Pleurochrysis_carterae.AAC.4